MKSAGEETDKGRIRERQDDKTHAVDGIGKRLGILQKFLRGGLEEGEITLIVVELLVRGLWRLRERNCQRPVQRKHGA